MGIKTIFHAHNWPFVRINASLDEISRTGYDAVQLSPLQKSALGNAWFLRYQPFDHLEIHGLGDQRELAMLCAAASRRGIAVIADVVFNHMAVPSDALRKHWLDAADRLAAGDGEYLERLYAKLSWFPLI
jgi:maltooligosyltrehalose synthase